MKKIISFILIIISSISVVSAKSINDLYNELNSLETKKNLYNYLTSDEINNILSASLDIEIVIDTLNDEINNINKNIEAKEKNIELTEKDRVNITVFGMVKNDKHQTRALMNDKREELEISQTLLNTITMFQDAVHDTAIGYHKKLRNEEVTRSALDNIKGIGTVKKVELLKKFGTVENISNASIEEIAEVKGINEELAVEIKNALIH